ncbi:small ribosomal subunit protein uS2m-like [Watersipora subatra]|uniref:small ribosomal subunit protein uS2m-like n=1 Tax=Watersipora subatra TaxID=2589382 RepID=UPI00355BBF76
MSASRFGAKILQACLSNPCKRCILEPHAVISKASNASPLAAAKHTIAVTQTRLFTNHRSYSVIPSAADDLLRKPEPVSQSNVGQSITQLQNDALLTEDYFGVGDLFTLDDLFEARVHLGHKEGLRHAHMTPYIYGNRLGQDIIDLEQTAIHLKLALNVLAHIAYRQGLCLFICRNRRNAILVEETAQACGEYAHCRNWRLGLFTNATFMYRSMTRLPDVCIFLGTLDNVFAQHKAVHEAAKMQVISIGVVDTNSDPRIIAYPIPGNDDTPSSVKLFCNLFKKSILLGKERWTKDESFLK